VKPGVYLKLSHIHSPFLHPPFILVAGRLYGRIKIRVARVTIQYLHKKSSCQDQDLCVNAWAVMMYYCASGVAEQARDHQVLQVHEVLSNSRLHSV
jgi:hypothetical protein